MDGSDKSQLFRGGAGMAGGGDTQILIWPLHFTAVGNQQVPFQRDSGVFEG